ncbi:MAG: ArsR family transcriptional regulator [Deltaproteobacteria bacterium RIFOXYD12_FULL_55_16]|nr:MAG: ArsR family transcriptional regulator [Deltaproteobacteria bacterium RIFOXYD12_FULL_55_16]
MQTTTQFFKALSEEPRLRILALLLGGELCVCDLMAVLQLPQSTVSRHLAYLRNTGWVEGRRLGAWMYYQLAGMPTPLTRELLELLKQRLAELPETRQDQAALAEFRRTKVKCA